MKYKKEIEISVCDRCGKDNDDLFTISECAKCKMDICDICGVNIRIEGSNFFLCNEHIKELINEKTKVGNWIEQEQQNTGGNTGQT